MNRAHAEAFAEGYFELLEKVAQLEEPVTRKATDSLTKATDRLKAATQALEAAKQSPLDLEGEAKAQLEFDRAQQAMYAAKARYEDKMEAERGRLRLT